MGVLIEVDELRGRLSGGERTVVLDVRWKLGDPNGREHYRDGHLPGAVYVDLDIDLAAPATPEKGRHPLPKIADLQAAARRWGMRTGDHVVAYDDVGGTSAARAWWLLRWAGVDDVYLLDGGLRAWVAAGGSLETGDVTAEPGDVRLDGGKLPVVDIDDVARFPASGTLLDARAAERYRGDVEPIDPRAGHVPGAVSAPTTGNLDDEVRFLRASALRQRFERLGVDRRRPVGVYCGSGVTATTRSPHWPSPASKPACIPARGPNGPPTRTGRLPSARTRNQRPDPCWPRADCRVNMAHLLCREGCRSGRTGNS